MRPGHDASEEGPGGPGGRGEAGKGWGKHSTVILHRKIPVSTCKQVRPPPILRWLLGTLANSRQCRSFLLTNGITTGSYGVAGLDV